MDLNVSPVPFDEQRYQQALATRKLRFGYFEETNGLGTSTSVKRAIRMVKQKLEELGHEVVPFNFHHNEAQDYYDIYTSTVSIGVLKQFVKMNQREYDEPINIYADSFFYLSLPAWLKRVVAFLVGKFVSKRMGNLLRTIKYFKSDEIDTVLRKKAKFEQDFKERWEDMRLDAMIAPVFPTAAFRASEAKDLSFQAQFLCLFNIVGYPAGVVPVTTVNEGEDDPQSNFNEPEHNDLITKSIKKSIRGSAGMPIGVQIATQKWKDEECLAYIKIVGDRIKQWKPVSENLMK